MKIPNRSQKPTFYIIKYFYLLMCQISIALVLLSKCFLIKNVDIKNNYVAGPNLLTSDNLDRERSFNGDQISSNNISG